MESVSEILNKEKAMLEEELEAYLEMKVRLDAASEKLGPAETVLTRFFKKRIASLNCVSRSP